MDAFLSQHPFELDGFQKDAIATIDKGHSVVVSAPTGSGKTLIAEFAAFKSIATGKRIFYTTPLKALSNQKFHDFQKEYGEDKVGLLTGDTSINRDAPIVVMTTEIFRNMLYGINTEPEFLKNVGYVVLDECHYMNDAQRGTVWEETIIYCPDHIQVIALSATVANADELTRWIDNVHHNTDLIQTDYRPVPLRFMYFDRDNLMPLLEQNGKLNKRLGNNLKGNRHKKEKRFFAPNYLIKEMHKRDMLPAIFFIFSRKDCDLHLKNTRDLSLLTLPEKKRLRELMDEYLQRYPFLKDNPLIPFIANGFASHHAGLLPALKHLVESLFQEGLIKAVFATETLAAGINMPARSTVITKISKRVDEGHRILHANEFHQMAGRAGRRGMDEVGYVVVVSSPYEGAREAATLAGSKSDPLNSQFTPTYGMVLNLLKTHTLEQSEFLIRKSFGQFTSARRLEPIMVELGQKESELAELQNFECPDDLTDKDFKHFLRSHDMLDETEKFVRILKKQIKQHGPQQAIIQQLNQEQAKKDNLLKGIKDSPCSSCKVLRKHEKKLHRTKRLEKQVKYLSGIYEREQDIYWRQFLNLYNLLKDKGYIDENDRPTDKGELAGNIRAENEYFIAEAVLSKHLESLTAEQLAAMACALVNDSNKPRDYSQLDVSHSVSEVLQDMVVLMKRVHKAQQKHNVDTSLNMNPMASGLVEAWAQNMDWNRLLSNTNIQEGDMVRILRRTSDILRQFSRNDDIPMPLSRLARQALKQIYREPVKEEAAVEVPEPDEQQDDQATEQSAEITTEDAGAYVTLNADEETNPSVIEPNE